MDTVLTVAITVGLSPAMAGAWTAERATDGWIDAIWPLAVGLGSICAALLAYGDFGRRTSVLTFIAVWASRFANQVSSRSHGSGQDPRYAEFIEQKSDRAASRLFLFLQIQARTAFILVPAVYLAATNDTPLGRLLDGLAILIAIVALTGEAISDRQLARFRRTPEAKTDVCDFGLWRYSRDQNYVLKWLFWRIWPIFALSAFKCTSASLLAPALMYWLQVQISGITPLKEHMLRSRGGTFRAPQDRVNAFFPGPRQHGELP